MALPGIKFPLLIATSNLAPIWEPLAVAALSTAAILICALLWMSRGQAGIPRSARRRNRR